MNIHDTQVPAIVDETTNESRPRKKRCKYIAKACNECKRRKIKCNGQTPCERCGKQRLGCVYANDGPLNGNRGSSNNNVPSISNENFQRLIDQMNAMQEHVAALSATVRSLTGNDASMIAQGSDSISQYANGQRSLHRLSSARKPFFHGPTTYGYSFDLAKSSLQRRGIVDRNESGDGDMTQEPSPMSSPSTNHEVEPTRSGDPIWDIGKSEALRLCRVYEEEMGIMYPVLELPQLLQQVQFLYGPMDPMFSSQVSRPTNGGNDDLDDADVHILRLVFACALTAEGSGRSELAIRLFRSVREVADNCVWGLPDIKNIILLTLLAIFYFQMDEEILAWRTIGIVERMCLEKGLHRRETLNHPATIQAGRDRVLRLFWSIYVLDMRWSFGTGMPFSLEDSDIDPWLPEPEEKTPYLQVMIRYSRIAGKAWKFISAFNNSNEIKKDDLHYLDWQVQRWANEMPDSLRLDPNSKNETRSLRRLRSVLYLRANQLRLLIHRPVLHTAAHIARHPDESETVVDIAQDTIRFITQLNQTSDIYQLQQVTFNWFLVSALAVLFLAVSQSPTQFSNRCKDEFYMALELVKGFSTQSYISRRLWKSIRSLRKIGPQLGLQKQLLHEPASVNNALDQDGDFVDPLRYAGSTSVHSQTPRDGEQMTQELMEWFEAVGNLENQIMGTGSQAFEDPGLPPAGSRMPNGGYMFDYGVELSSVLRDCF